MIEEFFYNQSVNHQFDSQVVQSGSGAPFIKFYPTDSPLNPRYVDHVRDQHVSDELDQQEENQERQV